MDALYNSGSILAVDGEPYFLFLLCSFVALFCTLPKPKQKGEKHLQKFIDFCWFKILLIILLFFLWLHFLYYIFNLF